MNVNEKQHYSQKSKVPRERAEVWVPVSYQRWFYRLNRGMFFPQDSFLNLDLLLKCNLV